MVQKKDAYGLRLLLFLFTWVLLGAAMYAAHQAFPGSPRLSSGVTVFQLVALVLCTLAGTTALKLGTHWFLLNRKHPVAEARMIGRLYNLLAVLGVVMAFVYGLGKLGAFGAVFAAFGGMLLGWSLQAPVSGFAAWVLVSMKRPFRPGDRIQFPNLGLTGDVKDVGLMYTVLDQVGGTIGSEEAVGRYILVPNAMLFSQVVINYTVKQESPYMLDEVVVRITYDSDWAEAERILIQAATEVTGDIIAATGVHPYVRSDMYDYGVYLRLRYQIRVNDRVEIAYAITKKIFTDFQRAPRVDWAIPFIYSYRAALERRETESPVNRTGSVQQIDVSAIRMPAGPVSSDDVEQVAQSIASHGLLQPIVVAEGVQPGVYDLLAGHLRFEACKRLGWHTVPAVVQGRRAPNGGIGSDGRPAASP